MSFARSLALAAALALPVLATPGLAHARKSADYGHRFEQVWSAAVRMVRVDLGFRIEDRDETIGYLLFEYRDTNGRTSPGSFELVRVREGERDLVRVVAQLPQKPSYLEQMLLDRLARKLTEEHGDPPAPPRRRPPDPPAEGDDGDGDDGAPAPEPPAEGGRERRRPR